MLLILVAVISLEMFGSSLDEIASPGSPKKCRKAHIDCSKGINSTTLLAACLAASEGSDAEKDLEILHSTIFNAKTCIKLMCARSRMIQPISSSHICIVRDPLSVTSEPETILDYLARNFSDCFENNKIVLWETLPIWVNEMSKSVFKEVFRAFANRRQQQSQGDIQRTNEDIFIPNQSCPSTNEAFSFVFDVIAVLICLESMGVQEVTCSPLPLIRHTSKTSSNGYIFDLAEKLAIDPTMTMILDETMTSASFLSTVFGIALLRVLTGTNKSQISCTKPMIVQKYGHGFDNEDSKLSVSIVFGMTENREHATEPKIMISNYENTHMPREDSLFYSDQVAHLETNLDDISGENLAFAIELLLKHGAIDAWAAPIVMKKGRPAHTLHCLCKDIDDNGDIDDNCMRNTTLNSLIELIFVHTSTLGIRIYRRIPRAKLDRSIVTSTTSFVNTSRKGMVDVKVSRFKNGRIVTKKAEFDHCKEIAMEAGVPIKVVAGQAVESYESKCLNRN